MPHHQPHHKIAKVLYFICFAVIALLCLWACYILIIPLALGFIIAFMGTPFVDNLERRGINRSMGALILFVGIGVVLSLGVKIIIPIIQDQVTTIQADLPQYEITFLEKISSGKQYLSTMFGEELVNKYQEKVISTIKAGITELEVLVPLWISSIFSALGTFIFVPVIAFFFINEGTDIKKNIVSLLPNRYFEMILMIIHQINNQLGSYIRGQFYDCAVIGILVSIGLSIVGVNGAITIGIFAGVANAIPYLGPIIGAIPATILLLVDPHATFPWWSVPIVFLIVNLLDNSIVYPMTVGKSLEVHPLIVILGILFGGSIAGIPGMILAVPVIGIGKKAFLVMRSTLKSYQII